MLFEIDYCIDDRCTACKWSCRSNSLLHCFCMMWVSHSNQSPRLCGLSQAHPIVCLCMCHAKTSMIFLGPDPQYMSNWGSGDETEHDFVNPNPFLYSVNDVWVHKGGESVCRQLALWHCGRAETALHCIRKTINDHQPLDHYTWKHTEMMASVLHG